MSATSLTGKSLIVVTGKGGVGKSVVAAAVARRLARDGLRALVLESDPRESQHQLFGCAPSGGDVIAAGVRLHVQNVSGYAAIEERVREQIKIPGLAGRVCGSETFRTFVAGAPGLSEVAVLGHAQRLAAGKARGVPKVDVVVLDAPATGHGLSLLEAPALVAETVGGGPFGDLARDVAAYVRDARSTALVAVTTAEEMPVDELLELLAGMRVGVGRAPDAVVVNALYPPWPRRGAPRGALADLWRRRRKVNERQLARLERAGGPVPVRLPMLPFGRGPELVEELSLLLDGGAG